MEKYRKSHFFRCVQKKSKLMCKFWNIQKISFSFLNSIFWISYWYIVLYFEKPLKTERLSYVQWTFTNLLDNHVSTEVLTTRADYRGECPPPSKLTITVFKRQNNIKSRHKNQLAAPDARFVYQRLLWCSCRKIWKFKATQNMKSIYYPNNPKRVPK